MNNCQTLHATCMILHLKGPNHFLAISIFHWLHTPPLQDKIQSSFLVSNRFFLVWPLFVFVNLYPISSLNKLNHLGLSEETNLCVSSTWIPAPLFWPKKFHMSSNTPSPVHSRWYPPVKLLVTSLPPFCTVSTVWGQSPLFFQSQQTACLAADINVSFDKWKEEWVTHQSLAAQASSKAPFSQTNLQFSLFYNSVWPSVSLLFIVVMQNKWRSWFLVLRESNP